MKFVEIVKVFITGTGRDSGYNRSLFSITNIRLNYFSYNKIIKKNRLFSTTMNTKSTEIKFWFVKTNASPSL